MRWPKVVRVVVAAVGLGTAAALVMLTRERPTLGTPTLTPGGDPAAMFQSGAGETVRNRGDQVVARAEYAQVRRYDDRMEWDDFRLTLGDGASLSAKHVNGKFSGANREQPSVFAFEGDVRFRSAGGATLAGESGTYDDTSGLASIPGPAVISRGGLAGRGNGGTYERTTGSFKLLADAHMTITPESGGAPIETSGNSITFSGNSLLLEEHAQIGRESDTMSADRATIYLADQQQFRTIELRGRARVAPVAGKTSDLPDLQADDIELEFYEGGGALQRASLHRQATMVQTLGQGKRAISASEVSFRTAPDGKTLTRLDASEHVSVTLPASTGIAARTITGATLNASGTDQAGLTAAVFDGGVEFVELGPASAGKAASRRAGRSQRLSLSVKGQLEAIESALFERDVRFTSNDVIGVGDLGDYRAAKGELELRPVGPGSARRARVEDGAVIVEAAESILVNLDTNDLHARRGVTTVSRSKAGSGGRGGAAMFDSTQPLYGSGTEFWYESSADRFRYIGDAQTRARLKQSDDSMVVGNEVVFQQRTQELTANGQVESVFVATGDSSNATTRYRATGASFRYDDVNRTVTYGGAPARLKFGDDETLANQIVLTLAHEGRTLERMDATGNVRTNAQQGRQALGDRLVYEPKADTYQLWGKPLTLWTREADGTCTSQNGNFVRITGETRAPEFPEAGNPAGNTSSSKLTCPGFLVTK